MGKGLAAKPERTDSHKLTSDLYMHECDHTYNKYMFKKLRSCVRHRYMKFFIKKSKPRPRKLDYLQEKILTGIKCYCLKGLILGGSACAVTVSIGPHTEPS